LSGEAAHYEIAQLIQPMLFVSLALVAAGIGLGILIYRRAGVTDPLQQAQPALFGFLENKMWLDELYARTVVALTKTAALLSDWLALTNAASTPASMKASSARAVSAA
jgi:hypothetical protein